MDFLCNSNLLYILLKMDQLQTDQQKALRKTNTERLRIMAAKTGDMDDDELETMDGTALLGAAARDIRYNACWRTKIGAADRVETD